MNLTQSPPCHILVIDDDPYTLDLFDLLGETLRDCHMHTAISGRKALERIATQPIHMVILDIVFGDKEQEGLHIMSELKQHPHTAKAYYMLMSAYKYGLVDRMRAYHLEAQDFIVKPFEVRELELLLQSKVSFFRNMSGVIQPVDRQQQVGKFCLNHALKHLQLDGHTIELTEMEFRLLNHLCSTPETVLSIKHILAAIWDFHNHFSHALDSNVRGLIRKLRLKIEPDPANPIYLVKAKSHGYIFYPSGKPTPKTEAF